jgi:hypothetical protein
MSDLANEPPPPSEKTAPPLPHLIRGKPRNQGPLAVNVFLTGWCLFTAYSSFQSAGTAHKSASRVLQWIAGSAGIVGGAIGIGTLATGGRFVIGQSRRQGEDTDD